MTQPPQWGRPHQPPPQPYPQQQQYQQPQFPPQPSELGVLATLNWVLAASMLGLAVFVVVSFAVSGGTMIVGILLAFVIGGFGALNVLATLSIAHAHFPNTAAARLAGGFTVLALGIALARSLRRGVADLVPSLCVLALLGVGLYSLYLASRPAVQQWIRAKHQFSLSQGQLPRNHRR